MNEKNLIYGRYPVIEALKEGKSFEKIFVQKTARYEEIRLIQQLAGKNKSPLQFVPIQKLNAITRKNHQGVIGYLSVIHYYKVDDVMMKIYEDGKVPLFLILDGVTDVRNLGAIARTAECTGVNAMIIPEKGGAMINADAMKASAGALNKLPVCKVKSLEATIEYLKLNGFQIMIADLEADIKLNEVNFKDPLAIVLGAEGKGVSGRIRELADLCFLIPMVGEIQSLNVTVAAGILLYEAMKQRM